MPQRHPGVVIGGSDVFQTHECRWSWGRGRVTPIPAHRVSARLSAIIPSAAPAVNAGAETLKAVGHPIIDFGTGEPDFPAPDHIVETAVAVAKDPANHKYSPAKSLPILRGTIAAKTLRDSSYEVPPDDILVTNDDKRVTFQAPAALVDLGNEALLPTPYWTTYPEAVALVGGTTVKVFAGANQDYKVSADQLEAARIERIKVLLLCSSSNPIDSVYTPEELTAIGQWALERRIWIITDEIYEHLLYNGAQTARAVQLVLELAEQTIILNGMAKTYAITGWRAGWMIAPSDVIKVVTDFQSHLTSNVANVPQHVALAAISGDLTAAEQIRTAFDRRRRTMAEMLSQIKGLTVPVPHGTLCVYPSIEGLVGRTLRDTTTDSSTTLTTPVLEHTEATIVPGRVSGPSGFMWLSCALGDDDLVEGVGRVQKLLAEVEQRLRPRFRHRARQVSRQPTKSLLNAAKPTRLDV